MNYLNNTLHFSLYYYQSYFFDAIFIDVTTAPTIKITTVIIQNIGF